MKTTNTLTPEYYIGVMSGTSLDGIDVSVCRMTEAGMTLTHSFYQPFDAILKERILHLIDAECTLRDIGEVDHQLGHLFADAVIETLEGCQLEPSMIAAIGLHGQTVWHQPDSVTPFTMQLGDPNIVAVRTGIKTVADFRRRDIALGGQGAPIAPAFHQFLFGSLVGDTVVVNIGGMSNISVLGNMVQGYDTGPGNVLMDAWCHEKFNVTFDKDGVIAQRAEIDEAMLEAMLADRYFLLPAPKSTGREYFNRDWLRPFVQAGMRDDTVLATLTEFTACSIANEVRRFAPERLLLCGGGANNVFLRGRIASQLDGVEVVCTDAYGIPGDWMESMAFAWLAYKRLREEAIELKNVTGASQNTILGAVYA